MALTVTTNHVPRDVISWYELTDVERSEFDYLNTEERQDESTFFRYKGSVHDLGEFMRDYGMTRGSDLPESLFAWDGYRSDSFFSALVVRYVDDGDRVIVGLVLS